MRPLISQRWVHFGFRAVEVKELRTNMAKFKKGLSRRDTFTEIMRKGVWGLSGNESGGGSTLEYTETIRGIIQRVVADYEIGSMVDVACGDFAWMQLVLEELGPDFRYIGGDIVPDLIERHRRTHVEREFMELDFVRDELPVCDLVFCRDVLQHLPVADIKDALINISGSGSKFLLATTHLRQVGWRNRRNIQVGKCNDRNLMLSPFNLANPLVIHSEQDAGNKFLGLWELPLRDKNGNPLAF